MTAPCQPRPFVDTSLMSEPLYSASPARGPGRGDTVILVTVGMTRRTTENRTYWKVPFSTI